MTAKRVFGKGGNQARSKADRLHTRELIDSWVYDLFDERLHNGDMASETRL
jgi:hypothetical protein